jgi:hypothetical protein
MFNPTHSPKEQGQINVSKYAIENRLVCSNYSLESTAALRNMLIMCAPVLHVVPASSNVTRDDQGVKTAKKPRENVDHLMALCSGISKTLP